MEISRNHIILLQGTQEIETCNQGSFMQQLAGPGSFGRLVSVPGLGLFCQSVCVMAVVCCTGTWLSTDKTKRN
jgi:hypothetical protein